MSEPVPGLAIAAPSATGPVSEKREGRLVRIDEPLALFTAERYLASPVPLPLFLLELVPGSVKADYERTETGVVANESDRLRRRLFRYPGGVHAEVEVQGDQVRGFPTVFDWDFFLGACRIADEGGIDADGRFIDPSYRALIRAAGRAEEVGGDHVESAKRALRRFGGLNILTRLNVDYRALAGEVRSGAKYPLVPEGVSLLGEREGRHGVLEYRVAGDRRRTTGAYDSIEHLRINPVWLSQPAVGIGAWIDVALHNGLRSGYAKRLLQQLTVRVARGWRVLEPWVLDLRELYALLEVPEAAWGRSQTRAAMSAAFDALREQGVLSLADIERLARGSYEVRLAGGERLLAVGNQRGMASGDSLADRVLLWHLKAIGFSQAQARDMIRARPEQVRTVLRRIHYLQSEWGGASSASRSASKVRDWVAFCRNAVEHEWTFAESHWDQWVRRQLAAAERVVAVGDGTPARGSDPGPGVELVGSSILPSQLLPSGQAGAGEVAPSFSDDLWGRAVAAYVAEQGDLQVFTSWLARTALEQETETELVVRAEDRFLVEWIQSKYEARLAELLRDLAGRPLALRFLVSDGRSPRLSDTAGENDADIVS